LVQYRRIELLYVLKGTIYIASWLLLDVKFKSKPQPDGPIDLNYDADNFSITGCNKIVVLTKTKHDIISGLSK